MSDDSQQTLNLPETYPATDIRITSVFWVSSIDLFASALSSGIIKEAREALVEVLGEDASFSKKALNSTISIGVEREFIGRPGVTPFSLLIQRDFSGAGSGRSFTGMLGKNEGFFVTGSFGNDDASLSLGVFGGGGNMFMMGAINVTDLFKGNLTFEPGYLQELGNGKSIELSFPIPAYSIEEAYDAFHRVLGPLLDYRNFNDPMGDGF